MQHIYSERTKLQTRMVIEEGGVNLKYLCKSLTVELFVNFNLEIRY